MRRHGQPAGLAAHNTTRGRGQRPGGPQAIGQRWRAPHSPDILSCCRHHQGVTCDENCTPRATTGHTAATMGCDGVHQRGTSQTASEYDGDRQRGTSQTALEFDGDCQCSKSQPTTRCDGDCQHSTPRATTGCDGDCQHGTSWTTRARDRDCKCGTSRAMSCIAQLGRGRTPLHYFQAKWTRHTTTRDSSSSSSSPPPLDRWRDSSSSTSEPLPHPCSPESLSIGGCRRHRRHHSCRRHHQRHTGHSLVSCVPPVPHKLWRQIIGGDYVQFDGLLVPTDAPPLVGTTPPA